MTDLEIIGSAERTFEDVVDTAVGGAALAVEPVRRPRATARRARRKGAEVTDEIAAQVRQTVALPERLLHDALRRVKREARREDVVGAGARVLLQGINVPAANAATFFARLERETEVPRPARRGRSTTATAASTRRKGGKRATPARARGGRAARRSA